MSPVGGPKKHLLHVFASFGAGGVPIRIATVLNHLPGAYRHTFVALDGNTDAAERFADTVDYTLFDAAIDKTRPLAALWRIRGLLGELRPDLLLTYNWGAVEWALVNRFTRRTRHIHFESGFGPEEADRQLPRRVRLRRLALAGSEAIVVPSHNLVRIATDIWRLGGPRLRYVPNGVDCAKFSSAGDASLLPGFAPRPNEVVIGTVAPLRAEKNIGRLIRAFAALGESAPARLVIVGDGPERPGLEALAAELGLGARALFAGYVARPEKIFKCLDVFAISSDTEQMPNALIQAMAAGRPVAGVDVGDVRHIVAPENHPFIVPRDDAPAFAAAIRNLVEQSGTRAALGAANERHVRATYSLDGMIRAYADLFSGAPGGGARS